MDRLPPGTERRSIRLALTGDVMLGRLVNSTIAERGHAYPWGDVLPALLKADLRLINLECCLTSCTREWYDGSYKPFHFRAEPAVVKSLEFASIDFACLANNHSGDFGNEGMLETVDVVDRAGISHAGAGKNLAAARQPGRLSAGGWRVAVVAFADYPPEWRATSGRPGINYTDVSTEPDTFAEVERAISRAHEGADLTIFTMHWGPNMREQPTQAFRLFARRVIDAGADVFWGHSAHVVQGVEIWAGRPILYDTGDFIDDYAVDPYLRNDLSGLFTLETDRTSLVRLRVLPVSINDMQVRIAEGLDREWFAQRFKRLCAAFGTAVEDDGGELTIQIAAGQFG